MSNADRKTKKAINKFNSGEVSEIQVTVKVKAQKMTA